MLTWDDMSGEVLVADDDPAFRAFLAEFLQGRGFSVATVDNGGDLITYLYDNPPPKLVLLDLGMPGTSGFDFLQLREQNPRLQGVPVVLVSGYASLVEDMAANLNLPCLGKPLYLPALTRTIERYCA